MTNVAKKVEKKVNKDSKTPKFSMAELLKKRAEQKQEIEVEKATRVRVKRERKLGKESILLLYILNAGLKGITIDGMVAKANETEAKISTITIKHNWNRQTEVQRGEQKLRTPYMFNSEWLVLDGKETLSEKEAKQKATIETNNGVKCDVYFVTVFGPKLNGEKGTNNRIFLADESMVPTLKTYLLSVGAKEEQFDTK